MPRVVHFEIAAADPERAAKFYTSVFDWKINKWGGPREYWLAETGKDGEPGINGGLHRRTAPHQATTNTVAVPDLDRYIEKVTKAGGTLLDRHAIPGIGYLAYCADTEGNTFGLLRPDENAK